MKADEVDLLVNEKDEIQFSLPKYMPFIDDPKIIRVVKEHQAVPRRPKPPRSPVRTVGTGTKEIKPRQHVKPKAAAPAPGSINEVKPPDQGSVALPAGDKKTEK